MQPIEGALGQHGGPVAGDHELEHSGQLPLPLRQPGLDLRQPMACLVCGRPEEDLDLLALCLQLLLQVDGLEPAAQVLELERLELVRLHQDVFTDPDLAEIVQHGRVAQLLTLLRGERGALPASRRLPGARQHVAEPDREPRHPARVTRGGRIPRLDRHHAGAHEPFEQLLDLVVQQSVVDRRRSLTAERGEQLLVLVGEGLPVELVQRLQDADDLALHRAHRHAEDGPGLVTRLLVDVLVEPRILVCVGDVDRRIGARHRARDPSVHRDADFLGADALRHLGPQLAALAIDEEQRAAVGLDHPRRGVDDQLQQPIEIALGDERFRDVEDASELLDALLKPVHRASIASARLAG